MKSKNFYHTHLQEALLKKFPFFRKEVYFHRIARRADLFWREKHLILELQCSYISSELLIERSLDYRKLGLNVLWLFPESQISFFRKNELLRLRKQWPCFELGFTSITPNGEGELRIAHSLFKGSRLSVFPFTFSKRKKSGLLIHKNMYLVCKQILQKKLHRFLQKNRLQQF